MDLPLGSAAVTQLSLLELASVVSGGTVEQALAEATTMAQVAETAGLARVWVAEHHGMPGVASSAPAVLLAHLAAETTSIRIGSGGVMLPNHAPLVVAEQFGTLEALHPGRVDLGIGRAPGSDPRTARALGRGNAERFPDDLVELIGYFTGASELLAVPGRGRLPEIWLLGSSTYSAQLAGMLGLRFSFAYHFAPQLLDAALQAYRSVFKPSVVLGAPRVMVAVSCVCAPSSREADFLAGSSRLGALQLRQGRPSTMPSPEEAAERSYSESELAQIEAACASHLVGDPEEVAAGLHALVARTGADELMLSTRVFDAGARRRSLELIAAAWAG
jgi:luciferase family oxidoreductase group 1